MNRETGDDIGAGTSIGCSEAATVGFGGSVSIDVGGSAAMLAISVFAISTDPAPATVTDPSLVAGAGATLTPPADDADASVLLLTGAIAALTGAAMVASLASSPFTHGSTTSSRPTASSAQPGGINGAI